MNRSDLERVYSSKTNDELLALAVDRRSLEPAAQSVIWDELRRRKLTHPSPFHPSASDGASGQNPAWNLPAKVGAVVILLACLALGLSLIIAVARAHQFLKLVLLSVLLAGSLLAALGWGTRRALRPHPSGKGRRNERG